MAYIFDGVGGPRNTTAVITPSVAHALQTTPLTLVAAPPAGYMVYPLRVKHIYVPGSHAYGSGSGAFQLFWGSIPIPYEVNGTYSTFDGTTAQGVSTSTALMYQWDYWKNQGSLDDPNLRNLITLADAQPLIVKPAWLAKIGSVSLTSNVVTITVSGTHPFIVGQSVTVLAKTTTAVNGTFPITAFTSNTFTYSLTHANISSTPDAGTCISGSDMTVGALLTAHITVAGTGPYLTGDTGTLDQLTNNPQGANYTVTGDNGTGVTTFSINTSGVPGIGYFVGQTIALTPNSGTGNGDARAVVDTVTQGDGTFKLYVEYCVLPTS